MFRRSFLAEHGIAFPEGRRRLEDQLFVVTAYFAARTISILADEPCYFYLRRADRGNAGSAQMEPAGYYANVREVVDVVLANAAGGASRLVRRLYPVGLLGGLGRSRLHPAGSPRSDDVSTNIRPCSLTSLTTRSRQASA